uniref:Uncharacterized protein n=1 Tax=Candidatus Kentrum sp. SD TaxID=2126332 RepID=A0A451BM82_9GAMM|nr:MAG: hypothetical protein BECKSD772D_GA0070982_10471 [Candidatus Kentron sp. SD]
MRRNTHLNRTIGSSVAIETIKADGLFDKLASFHRDILSKKVRSAMGDGLGFQRVAFLFHGEGSGQGRIQHLTIIKPDEYRCWTRSQAMRDMDDLASAILRAAQGGREG